MSRSLKDRSWAPRFVKRRVAAPVSTTTSSSRSAATCSSTGAAAGWVGEAAAAAVGGRASVRAGAPAPPPATGAGAGCGGGSCGGNSSPQPSRTMIDSSAAMRRRFCSKIYALSTPNARRRATSRQVDPARVKGMAAQQPAQTLPAGEPEGLGLERQACILRTCGVKTTRGRQNGRKKTLIQTDEPDRYAIHAPAPSIRRDNWPSKSRRNLLNSAVTAGCLKFTTMSTAGRFNRCGQRL